MRLFLYSLLRRTHWNEFCQRTFQAFRPKGGSHTARFLVRRVSLVCSMPLRIPLCFAFRFPIFSA